MRRAPLARPRIVGPLFLRRPRQAGLFDPQDASIVAVALDAEADTTREAEQPRIVRKRLADEAADAGGDGARLEQPQQRPGQALPLPRVGCRHSELGRTAVGADDVAGLADHDALVAVADLAKQCDLLDLVDRHQLREDRGGYLAEGLEEAVAP